ncbi:hypothetical protein HDU96_010307 [Phlyctochytrium bullatum]|nr:hypothetical protein HDU96_010307 [Phlyctochytrium bullatum]
MLAVELIHRILLFANDLEVAIATELLLARLPRPFCVRINADPAKGPIRDAVEALLPDHWTGFNETHFSVSLAISQSLIVEPDGDVKTTPAFRLAWVCKFRPELITFKYVMRVAGAGRLDLVQILDAFEVPKFCMGTMDEAAAAGHLAVVKFLHYRRTEGCTSWAMTKAAKGGFLDILRFLHANRTEGCRDSALTDAATEGHFDVVLFLQTEYFFFPDIGYNPYWHQRYKADIPTSYIRRLHGELGWPITNRIVYDVMTRGTSEEFRYCLGNVFIPSHDNNLIRHAFMFGKRPWLENLKILFEDIGSDDQYWGPDILDWLARDGNLEMLEFLYEHRKERCSREGISNAARFGHADIFKFLVANDVDALSKIDDEVLDSAVKGGNVKILKLLRAMPVLENQWTSDLTNKAHMHVKVDAVRYLAAELGLPVTRVSFYDEAHVSTALFDLEPFHYDCADPNFYKPIFVKACRFGTLEQVARLSLRVPDCQLNDAYRHAINGKRLDVLHFLHENRDQQASPLSLSWSPSCSVEMWKFLVEKLGMRFDVWTLSNQVSSGRLDVIKYLYELLPADAPLDIAISEAIDHGQFEIAKFLHMKRRATRIRCCLSRHATNMDVATFAVENYLPQIDVDNAMNGIKSPCFHQMDVCKYILEGGYFRGDGADDRADGEADDIREGSTVDLDCFQYLLKAGFINVESLLARRLPFREVSIMRALWEFCPELVTTETVLAVVEMNCLPLLRYLSHVAPHLFDSSVVSEVLSMKPSDAQLELVRLILDSHPEHVKWHDHLPATVETNTSVAMLLWERWPGGCPRKAMEAACLAGNTMMLAKFLERMHPKDAEWKATVDKCLRIARKSASPDLMEILVAVEARTAVTARKCKSR